jgi:hypothetical protein
MQSLIIDTNILVLLIVGTLERDLIRTHRRTRSFAPQDYDLLQLTMGRYGRLLTTHGVLTEASNLMGNDFHQEIAGTLIAVCSPLVEVIHPKETVFAQEGFARLGFADSSILGALDEDTVVLTDDVDLYTQVMYLGWEALNFNHLRRYPE